MTSKLGRSGMEFRAGVLASATLMACVGGCAESDLDPVTGRSVQIDRRSRCTPEDERDSCLQARLTARQVEQRTRLVVSTMSENTAENIGNLFRGAVWQSLSRALANFAAAFANVPPLAFLTRSPQQPLDASQLVLPSQEINAWLAERVFNPEYLESGDQSGATFLLPGSAMCGTITECVRTACDLATNPDCVPQICSDRPNEACIRAIDEIQTRIEAKLVGVDGVELDLLLGERRFAPLELELSPVRLAANVDLHQIYAAAESMQGGAQNAALNMPDVLEGRAQVALDVNGAYDATLSASISQATRLEASTEHGPVSLLIGSALPLLQVRAQGQLGKLSVAMNAGVFDFSLPYSALTSGVGTGNLDLHVAGVTWGIELVNGSSTLPLTNISLGQTTSTLAKGGELILALDVNATSGRRFALTITPDSVAQSALLSFAPELRVRALCKLGLIANEFPNVDSFLMNESYEIALSGSQGASFTPVAPTSTWTGGVKINSGSLSISSSTIPAPFVVQTGQCLSGTPTLAPGAHPLLGRLVAGPCP